MELTLNQKTTYHIKIISKSYNNKKKQEFQNILKNIVYLSYRVVHYKINKN